VQPLVALPRAAGTPSAEASRRSLLLFGSAALSLLARPVKAEEENEFVQELLRRSEEKREERRVQRLRDYDRRNFGDYFAFSSNGGSRAATENDRAILAWMAKNGLETQ